MKKTSSLVWRIFDRVQENHRCVAVLCKLCDTQYKYFGNTTNLRTHLLNKHPIQWELLQNGTLDDATIRLDDDDSNQSSTAPRRKRFVKAYKDNNVDVLENSETENEGHVETNDEPTLLREMHNTRTSDEEWLNEEVYEEVDYQPVRKKPKYRTIKREIQSPPQRPEKYRVVQHHNYTKPPAQRVVVNSPKKDDYSVFGEYIGNRLRKFKNPQTRSNLQQLISTIVWQAEYGLYDNIENVKRVLLSSVQDMEVVQAVEQPVHEETIPEGDQTDLIEN